MSNERGTKRYLNQDLFGKRPQLDYKALATLSRVGGEIGRSVVDTTIKMENYITRLERFLEDTMVENHKYYAEIGILKQELLRLENNEETKT